MDLVFILGFIIAVVIYIVRANEIEKKVRKLEILTQKFSAEILDLKKNQTIQPEKPTEIIDLVQNQPSESSETVSEDIFEEKISQLSPEISPKDVRKEFRQFSYHEMQEKKRPLSRTHEEWEQFFGGQVLNRIGAIALIIGVGFFMKYAFDNNWINETMRVLIGAVSGLGLLALAWRTHKKGLEIFSQGLVGAGISILYISVYASFNFYHLMPQIFAFVLMSGVTMIAFSQAILYDSLAVAVLSLLGGFLTPFMLSTGVVNETGLFTYISLLDVGILAVCMKRTKWFVLEPLAFSATWLIFMLWFEDYFSVEDCWLTVYFLVIFWGLFCALNFYRIVKLDNSHPKERQAISILNAAFFYAGILSTVNYMHHELVSLFILLMAGAYFLTYYVARKSQPDNEKIWSGNALTAIIFFVLAANFQYSGFELSICWSIQAMALIWCGFRWNIKRAWQSGLIIFKLVAFQIIRSSVIINIRTPIMNEQFLAFAVLAFVLADASIQFKKLDTKFGKFVRSVLMYSCCTLIFLIIPIEIWQFFEFEYGFKYLQTINNYHFSIAVSWALYSLPLVWLGVRRKLKPLFISGLISLGISFLFLAFTGREFEPIEWFSLFLNVRFGSFLLVMTSAIVVIFFAKKHSGFSWTNKVISGIQLACVLFVWELFSIEEWDYFEKEIWKFWHLVDRENSMLHSLQNLQQLCLSGVWMFYSAGLMAYGLLRRKQDVRIVSIVLFGASILKIFLFDLSSLPTLYRIFSFIGLGVILLAASYFYQRYKSVIFEIKPKEMPKVED